MRTLPLVTDKIIPYIFRIMMSGPWFFPPARVARWVSLSAYITRPLGNALDLGSENRCMPITTVPTTCGHCSNSASDSVAYSEQSQREQNRAEYASHYGGPSPRRGQRLVCVAKNERFESDLQSGLGTFLGPTMTGWWKLGCGPAKRGINPGGLMRSSGDCTG